MRASQCPASETPRHAINGARSSPAIFVSLFAPFFSVLSVLIALPTLDVHRVAAFMDEAPAGGGEHGENEDDTEHVSMSKLSVKRSQAIDLRHVIRGQRPAGGGDVGLHVRDARRAGNHARHRRV